MDASEKASEDRLLEELKALYQRADQLFDGARCELSTECCRFGITGREPQVTSVEVALLRRALASRGGKPLKKRALPLASSKLKDERTCPLLDSHGKCAVYLARPLGCRTFFCARADVPAPPSRRELKELVRDLQSIASRHAPSGEKGRALTAVLAAER